MKLNEYQDLAASTAKTEDIETDVAHFGFGLAAEAGEVASIFQKYFRGDPRYYDKTGWLPLGDDFATFTPEAHNMVLKELGDVLWHVAVLARTFNLSLEDVAKVNLEKLASRAKRGVIQGDGDER